MDADEAETAPAWPPRLMTREQRLVALVVTLAASGLVALVMMLAMEGRVW
jgi:hypothetical protein